MAYKSQKDDFTAWLRLGTKEARALAGEPLTISAWAEVNKVARKTCQEWKNDPDVKRAVADHGISLFTVDEITRARDNIVRNSDNGNVVASKLLLEWAGVAPAKGAAGSQTAPPPTKSNPFAHLSDEEIEAVLANDEDYADDGAE